MKNSKVWTSRRAAKPDITSEQKERGIKFTVAIIQRFKLDAVREGLTELGVLTASEVRGSGRQRGHREVYRGSEYKINYVTKVKIEIAVGDDIAERVVETVQNVAQTGEIGDGKIFVFELSEAIRVRTGETGEGAL